MCIIYKLKQYIFIYNTIYCNYLPNFYQYIVLDKHDIIYKKGGKL